MIIISCIMLKLKYNWFIYKKKAYLASTINFIAVLSSPSITISVKAGMHTRFLPDGATNPLAIAIAFIAWFNAPAPIAWISTLFFSLKTLARAPATELGFYFVPTLSVSIVSVLSFYYMRI